VHLLTHRLSLTFLWRLSNLPHIPGCIFL